MANENGKEVLPFLRKEEEPKNGAREDYRKIMTDLTESAEDLEHLGQYLNDMFALEQSSIRNFFANKVQSFIPKSFQEFLPMSVARFVAEETDILARMESSLKENVNRTQDALKELAVRAKITYEERIGLQKDIKRAREENWNARQLQDYMSEKADIEVYEEVAEMLDNEFGFLSEEEKEKRKEDLLINLENNLTIHGRLVDLMGKVAVVGIKVFHRGGAEYYNFMKVYKPFAAIRDSAKGFVKMDAALFQSKQALVETMKVATDALVVSAEAAELSEEYSLSSGSMLELFKDCGDRLEEKILALEAKGAKLLPAASTVSSQEIELRDDLKKGDPALEIVK